MGTDKALIEIDGIPMARRVADALAEAGAGTVAAVGGDVESLRDAGLDVYPDRWPGEGPLGGVISSLHAVGTQPLVAVLSCDILDPDAGLISRLVDRCQRVDADLVVPVADGRPQWTHGVWRRSVADLLDEVFATGERSLVGASAGLQVERWDVPDPAVVADADEPCDLRSRRGHP